MMLKDLLANVLLVDEPRGLWGLTATVTGGSRFVEVVRSADEALSSIVTDPWAVVVSRMGMQTASGQSLSRSIRVLFPETEHIVVGTEDQLADAVRDIQQGASDCLVVPTDGATVRCSLERALGRWHAKIDDRQDLEMLRRAHAELQERLVSVPAVQGQDTLILRKQVESLRAGNLELLSLMVRTAEQQIPFLRGQSSRVKILSTRVADAMGLPEKEKTALSAASDLRDVGNIFVRNEYLVKGGPLSPGELDEVRSHPIHGEETIRRCGVSDDVIDLVRHHHERYDGTGYPDALRGDQLSLTERVFALCDAYAAMTSPRPYRPPRSHAEALKEVLSLAGKQFDPRVAEVFRALFLRGRVEEES